MGRAGKGACFLFVRSLGPCSALSGNTTSYGTSEPNLLRILSILALRWAREVGTVNVGMAIVTGSESMIGDSLIGCTEALAGMLGFAGQLVTAVSSRRNDLEVTRRRGIWRDPFSCLPWGPSNHGSPSLSPNEPTRVGDDDEESTEDRRSDVKGISTRTIHDYKAAYHRSCIRSRLIVEGSPGFVRSSWPCVEEEIAG